MTMTAKIDPENGVSESNVEETTSATKKEQQKSFFSCVREIFHSDKSPVFTLFILKNGGIAMPATISIIQLIIYSSRCYVVSDAGMPFALRVATYARPILILIEWIYIYFLNKNVPSDVLKKEEKIITRLGNVIVVLQALLSGLIFLIWVFTRYQCQSDACLQDFPKQLVPPMMLTHQIMGSIVMPFFFTCHDFSAAILSVIIAYCLILAGAVLLHVPAINIFQLFVVGIIVLGLYVSNTVQRYASFTSYFELQAMFLAKEASENKVSLTNIQTEEMRHMIGMSFYPFLFSLYRISTVINATMLV